MIKNNEIIIPIPRIKNTPIIHVYANGDKTTGTDITGLCVETKWKQRLLKLGVGNFSCKVYNPYGINSKKYPAGTLFYFYADYDYSGNTRQFIGRLDYPKESLGIDGQYIEFIGRHRSYFLSERKVCYSATNIDLADALRNIISLFAPECTYINVATTGIIDSVSWDYVNFIECVSDLMTRSGFDCYIDDDLDFHFFKENSVINRKEDIAENDNYNQTQESGTDNYYEKTNVTVIGQDDSGIPIIYTATLENDTSATATSTETREIFKYDASANTLDIVKSLAQSTLNTAVNIPPTGIYKSLGLQSPKLGENIPIIIPRQKTYGFYKLIEYEHTWGVKQGIWFTISNFEKEVKTTDRILSQISNNTENTITSNNPNKLNFSYNFPFDDDTLTSNHYQTHIINGMLELSSSGYSTGTWTAEIKEVDANISELELRFVGKDLNSSLFYYTVDGGINYVAFSGSNILTIPTTTNKKIGLKIVLIKDATNLWPSVDSAAILYSY